MAKWGEGDPRWIVEERADAVNVNNWHWTEKNASLWSKNKFDEMFKDMEIETDEAFQHQLRLCPSLQYAVANVDEFAVPATIKITNVSKADGEACVNNRKAKLIFFYEWILELQWSGSLSDSDNVIKGKVEIPNLSEENEVHEIDVLVTSNKRSDESEKLVKLFKIKGIDKIRELLGKYIYQLKNEFIQGMILPAKDKETQIIKQDDNAKKAFKKIIAPEKVQGNAEKGSKPLGVPIATKKLVMTEEFLMSAEDLYSTLTEEQRVSAFTRGPAKVDAIRGGQFALLNGNVSGKFTDLVRDEKIVMEWRQKSWPEGHHSTVSIVLTEKDSSTELKLTQTGVPEMKYDETLAGWKQYYWEAIKRTFSCGMRYF